MIVLAAGCILQKPQFGVAMHGDVWKKILEADARRWTDKESVSQLHLTSKLPSLRVRCDLVCRASVCRTCSLS
jgi:hypothetical protein